MTGVPAARKVNFQKEKKRKRKRKTENRTGKTGYDLSRSETRTNVSSKIGMCDERLQKFQSEDRRRGTMASVPVMRPSQ